MNKQSLIYYPKMLYILLISYFYFYVTFAVYTNGFSSYHGYKRKEESNLKANL